jgi:hypothetical protein
MSEAEMTKPMPEATQDARALLARLYREIGISAVTEALQLRDAPEPELKAQASNETPASLRGDTLAA